VEKIITWSWDLILLTSNATASEIELGPCFPQRSVEFRFLEVGYMNAPENSYEKIV
jgi:hypothetical protein